MTIRVHCGTSQDKNSHVTCTRFDTLYINATKYKYKVNRVIRSASQKGTNPLEFDPFFEKKPFYKELVLLASFVSIEAYIEPLVQLLGPSFSSP